MDSKSIAHMIVDRGNGSLETEDPGTDTGEPDEGQKAAAEEVLSAFQANDPVSLVKAFKSLLAMC